MPKKHRALFQLTDISYQTSDGNQEVSSSTDTIMPNIGARFNAGLTNRISAGARMDYYNMDFNQISLISTEPGRARNTFPKGSTATGYFVELACRMVDHFFQLKYKGSLIATI